MDLWQDFDERLSLVLRVSSERNCASISQGIVAKISLLLKVLPGEALGYQRGPQLGY